MIFDATYLQIFWFVQLAVYALLTITSFTSGKHWDKAQLHRDAEQRLGWIEFRKRPGWLYWVALLWGIYITWTVVSACADGTEPNSYFASAYHLVTSPKHTTAELGGTYVALLLYLAHVSRRLYECVFVSIYSRRQVTGPVSFVLDWLYHIAVGLSLIAESPDLKEQEDCLPWSQLHWYHLIAVIVFYFASKIHNNTHHQLATLRRNKSGHIVTTNYKMPKGGWFDTLGVSNPHYLAEIIIYVCIGAAFGFQNTTWLLLTAYVAANQIYLAYNTQQLYKYKFDDYPKNRKMLIPFLF